MTTRTAVFAAVALMLASLAAPHFADGQPKEQYTYRCTGKDGRNSGRLNWCWCLVARIGKGRQQARVEFELVESH